MNGTPTDFGLTTRQVNYWVEKKWLHPAEGGGTGRPLRWTASELVIADRMARLVRAGLTPVHAAVVARRPAGTLVDVGHGVWIVVDPTTPPGGS